VKSEARGASEGSPRHDQRRPVRIFRPSAHRRPAPSGRLRVATCDPVIFDVERPPAFGRLHVVLRLALLVVISWIGHPFGLLWLALPVVAAIFIAQKDGRRYLDEDAPKLTGVLRWIVTMVAYLALLTDRLPGGGRSRCASRSSGRAPRRSARRCSTSCTRFRA
jgi:hypothetical protein